MNLETKADVLRFCEMRRAEMVRCFERLGRFECNGYSFGAYVFATHAMVTPADPSQLDDYKPGKKLARVEAQLCRLPKLIHAVLPPEQHTFVFGKVLRAFAKMTRSVGVLIMSEAWAVSYTGATERSPDEIRSEFPDNLEDAPERRESLFMQLEHTLTGRRMWSSPIERNPTRLQPWSDYELGADAQGRLVDLVDWRS